MSYIVHWSDNALAGLVRVHAFLAQNDPQAAQKALDAIEVATDVLEQFPMPDAQPMTLSRNTGNC